MPYFCGIDIGASTAKLVLIDEARRPVARVVRSSGVDYAETARQCLAEAINGGAVRGDQIAGSLSTGYGRENVPFADGRSTEITCHAKGAFHHVGRPITVIDIGAQDSKIIRLDAAGRRTGFKMNRKCAAGTGAFLEEIAHRLDLQPAALNGLAERSNREVGLNSFCTVFAATEILEKIRAGEKVEDIVKGAFRSVVKRVMEMGTVGGELVMTGGVVAHNPLLGTLLGEAFGREAIVPPHPQFIGAFGAALLAWETCKGDASS